MGAHPYWYSVKYQLDIGVALNQLRQREFCAGRYSPVMPFISFPITPSSPAPGAQHRSIDEAIADADTEGTRSILDIADIGDEPDNGVAAPLAPEVLVSLYGTEHPTRAAVEANMDFLEDVERGHAVYIVLYSGGKPTELFFAGYSYD